MNRHLIAAMLFAVWAGPTAGQTPESAPRFPEINAENLLGESISLPDELPGRVRVVFVAFRQRQQSEVNTWLAVADQLEADYDGLRYFELPTIARPYRLMKPIIDNGMRSGIPSDDARARTITLFTSVSKFVDATGLPGTDQIATLLLDGEGRIRWWATGPHSREREVGLRHAIDGLAEGTSSGTSPITGPRPGAHP